MEPLEQATNFNFPRDHIYNPIRAAVYKDDEYHDSVLPQVMKRYHLNPNNPHSAIYTRQAFEEDIRQVNDPNYQPQYMIKEMKRARWI